MSCKGISNKSTNSSRSIVDDEPRDTFLEEGKSHESIILGSHGYDYQQEMFLYFCLQLMKMPNCKWICGFEVKLCEKFDDIVMEFTIDDINYSYLIQSKHVESEKNIITLEHLLDVKNTENDSLKKNFALIHYANALEKVDWTESRQRQFFLLTNYSLDLTTTYFEIKKKNKTIEQLNVIAPKTISEERNKMIMEFFNDMQSKKFTKFPNNIQLCDGKSSIKCTYFLENFTIVSELPNLKKLKKINKKLLEDIFKSNHIMAIKDALFKAFHVKKIEMPSNEPPADGVAPKMKFIYQRDPLSKEKFIEIIEKTIVHEDLPQFSAEYVNQFPEWINFSSDTSSDVQQQNYCSGNAKLFAYMLYKKILAKENEENRQKILCVSLSKLKEVHLKYIKNFDGKLVIHIDEKGAQNNLKDYKNVFLVFQALKKNSNKFCQFEDLSEETKNVFLDTVIKYQGFNVKIGNLTTSSSLRTLILQEINFGGKVLEFGTTLPLNELPDYYIKRKFSLKKPKNVSEIFEDDIFVQGKNTIIQGLGGTGKSTTMLKLAEKVKAAHPDYSVYLVDLKAHNEALCDVKEGKIDISSSSKVWYFVLDNFLQMNTKDKILERCLLEAHIKQETPKIIIFLDGFDEISPLYSEQVEEIINELKKMKVQIFISSQPHLNTRMQQLEFDTYYTLEPYDKEMQGEFLRRYWTNYVKKQEEYGTTDIDLSNINIFVKKFFKMCYKSKLTDITPSIPLMLNILADIYSEECFEFCKKNPQDESKKFLEIDVLTIYEKIFLDNHRKFYRKTNETITKSVYYQQEEAESVEKWRKIYTGIALHELEGDIWKKGQSGDFQKGRAEVFGRGLITGQTINHYEFIYKTFGEYFAADWFTQQIFLVNGKLNIHMLKILMKKDGPENKNQIPKGIKSFIYRFVLRRLKNLQTIEFDGNEKKQLAEFIVGFFQYAWFNRENSQLETTFKIAQIACEKEQVAAVLREKRATRSSKGEQYKNLLELVPFTSPEQFELSLKIYDEYLTKEETNKILTKRCDGDMASIINLIIKDTNLPLFKKFFEIITKRKIFSKEDFISKFYAIFQEYLKKQKVRGWMFVRDIYFWYFKQIHAIDPLRTITKEDILKEMEIILKEKKTFQERHYLGHIFASFWEWKEKDDSIIVEAFERVKLTNTCYRFLYALNSITRDDILERTIKIMQDHKYNFISDANRSILFDAFEDNNSHLLRKLLYLLKKEEIAKLIDANVCGGTPLIRQCTKENYICEILIQYMVNEFGEEVVDVCFDKPFGNEEKVEDNVKIFSIFFRKNMEVSEDIFKHLVKRLCDVCNNSKLLTNIFLKRNTDSATEYFMMYLKNKR